MQLPVVKVILKPLLFDHNDHSKEAIFLRSRIGRWEYIKLHTGAFEVQLFSRNVKGETIQRTIFSKLSSKCWPIIPRVVEEVTEYLPQDDIIVRVIDNKFNMEAYRKHQEEKKKDAQPSKLRGLKVTLRPLKLNKNQSKLSNLFPECSSPCSL
jgi:hypothetical protein